MILKLKHKLKSIGYSFEELFEDDDTKVGGLGSFRFLNYLGDAIVGLDYEKFDIFTYNHVANLGFDVEIRPEIKVCDFSRDIIGVYYHNVKLNEIFCNLCRILNRLRDMFFDENAWHREITSNIKKMLQLIEKLEKDYK